MNRHLLIHLPDTVYAHVFLSRRTSDFNGSILPYLSDNRLYVCGTVVERSTRNGVISERISRLSMSSDSCCSNQMLTRLRRYSIPTEATRGKAHLWCGLPVEESDGTMRKCRFRCNNQEHLQRHRKGTENYREGHHSTNGAASVQSTEDTKTSRHLSSTSSAPRRRKRKVPLESSPALSSPPPTKRRRSKASPLILWTTTPSAPHTEPGPLHLRNGVPPPSPPPPCPLAPQLQAETRRCDASNLTPSDERPIAPLPSRSTPCVFLPLSAAWSLPFKRPSTYRGGLTGAFSAHSRDIYYRPSWLS